MAKRINYRKIAFQHYPPVCAHCGFGIPSVLEVAHIDGNRRNNDLENLVILCANCHKMHDLDIISTQTIVLMRDRPTDTGFLVVCQPQRPSSRVGGERRRDTGSGTQRPCAVGRRGAPLEGSPRREPWGRS